MTKPTNLKPWKILDSKIVHSTPWIEIKQDKCQTSGQVFNYTYTRRVDEGPLIIAQDHDQKLWLVRQYRHPIKKIIWQFPAEGKHPKETWEQAAKRGLQEELKLKAGNWQNLGQFYVDPGGLEQKYQAFLATNLSPASSNLHQDSQGKELEIENLEIAKFSLDEINQMITQGAICDNWTLAALYLYQRFAS